MVPGPGRDARVRKVQFRGDHRHDRLRSVSPGHGEPVRATLYGSSDKLFEIVAAAQLDRFDPAAAGLVGKVEALGLAAAGKRVVEQHRVRWPRGRWKVCMDPECHPRRGQRGKHRSDHEHVDQHSSLQCHEYDRPRQQQGRDREPNRPCNSHSAGAVPSRTDRQHETQEHRQASREMRDGLGDGQDERR